MENIASEGKIACNKQFLLFSQCLLPYIALIFYFKCTLKCMEYVSIWTSLKCCYLVMGYPGICCHAFIFRQHTLRSVCTHVPSDLVQHSVLLYH